MIKLINAIKPDINNSGIKNGVNIIIKNMIAKNNIMRIIKLTIYMSLVAEVGLEPT